MIIWEEAALAEYVLKNKVGVTVKSLYDIKEVIGAISAEKYREMRNNAIQISADLRKGANTKGALSELGIL